MNWKALLHSVLVAAANAAIAVLVHQLTNNPQATAVSVVAGTAVAHAMPSPWTK